MKVKSVIIAALLIVALGCIGGFAYAWQPVITPVAVPDATAQDPSLVANGARLVAIGSCAACHTAAGGKSFAGGRPLATPFGTLYTTNITPDVNTGIGNWSLDAFKRAMRTGVARDGHLLYPAFPYAHYTKMADGDIAAIYAFLMTRDPVQAVAPDNRLTFPLNFRPLLAGWNLLFLHPGAEPVEASQSAEWNRGRYLVDSLGHCAACHSPLNALGAEKAGQPFAGGLADGWDGPPLNALSHAPIPWTKPQLVSYLRTGLADQHGAAAGPMLEVTQALATVPEQDVAAIAEYLLSLQSAPAASTGSGAAVGASAATADVSAADLARAQRGGLLFSGTCAACHGVGAPMTTIGARPRLGLSTVLNGASPRNAVNLILHGIPWAGADRVHYMPPFADALTDEQIGDIATYLRVQFAHKPAWPALDETVVKLRKESNPS